MQVKQNSDDTDIQTHANKTFSQFFSQARIPSALLIVQENGADLASFSEHFAAWLLCEKPLALGACEQCRACVLYREKSHPDYYVFGEDSASTCIDEIRELNQYLQQTAHQLGRKVVVLHGVDRYLPGVANALLKILEEPIGDVAYLLLAQRRQRVMATISSRCVKMILDSDMIATSPLHEQCQQLFLNPQTALFNESALQDWMIENTQEAFTILYHVIKKHITHALQKKVDLETLKPIIVFADTIIDGLKQASLPGINKLLLIESIFYQWQEIYEGI